MKVQDKGVCGGGVRGVVWMLAAAAVLTAVSESAQALPRIERYVSVSVSPQQLDLGSVRQPGTYDSLAILTVHLAANCNHGGVVISTTQFESAQGGAIPQNRILIRLPGTEQFVPMTNPVQLTPPGGPVVDEFEICFRIQTEVTDPAGAYTGTFQLSVAGANGHPPVPGPSVACTLELELYAGCELVDTKSYIHLGNVFSATEEDMTVHTTGALTANAGVYIGLDLSAMPNINGNSFEKDGAGNLTGRIEDAMAGTLDGLGRDISDEAFDLSVLLSWDGGGSFNPPECFGRGPNQTMTDALWWKVNNGQPGEYGLSWKIQLLPEPHQADGNYYLESTIVVTPVL